MRIKDRAMTIGSAIVGLCILSSPLYAADLDSNETPSAPDAAAPVPTEKPAEKSAAGLTYHGVTLYGTFDIGVAYLNHGAPLSSTYGPGLPFQIQKFSNRAITSIAPNGLSQSKIGLSGVEPLTSDLDVVFKLETGFQPTSFQLTDGPKSLVHNNGRPLTQQIEAGDTSRAGQPFEGAAYGGVKSKDFGTVTFGRQSSLILDNLNKYDPQMQSQAFSLIGYSGVASGGGDTEDGRLDSTLKYVVSYRPIHLAVLHQFGTPGSLPAGADEVDLGSDFGGFSVDAGYAHVLDAVSAASLTAAQSKAAPGTLAATVSDNTTYSINAKYSIEKITLYSGYENIVYENPGHPLVAGVTDIGGYIMSVVKNTSFTHHKVLQISWVGSRYMLTKALTVSAAYYRYDQNSYSGNGCANTSASNCSGTQNAASVVADYSLNRLFDVYGGVNYSTVANGLASGYLQNSVMAPMVGVRLNF